MTNKERIEIGSGQRTYAVRVLGCKVNTYEAEQIRRRLALTGMRPVREGEAADVAVVHTCAVTSEAVRKSRQAVRRLQRLHPGARLIVTGCAAGEDLLGRVEGVRERIGPREDWLESFQGSVRDLASAPAPEAWKGRPDHLPVVGFAAHSRAFLKIQDGCDLGCSFCIVPRLRRAPRDKPLPDILSEAESLVAAGHREVVVSGVSVGLYGRDAAGPTLAGVLAALVEVEGIERIRLSSLHPRELTDELLRVWGESSVMMPHVHLPLQAGSDRILRAMNRSYTAAEFLDAVDRARQALDDPAFNTDVIAGFPGETEEDFAETMRICEAVGFSRMHVFPYSVRPHTRAVRLTGRVDGAAARERCRRLQQLAETMAAAFRDRFVGHEAAVLAEDYDEKNGSYRGYTERYIPVRFNGPPGLGGRILRVDQTAVQDGEMTGSLVSGAEGVDHSVATAEIPLPPTEGSGWMRASESGPGIPGNRA